MRVSKQAIKHTCALASYVKAAYLTLSEVWYDSVKNTQKGRVHFFFYIYKLENDVINT